MILPPVVTSFSFLLIFNSEQITKQQSHIDRLYVSLKDMVDHRKTKLEQQYWLYQLHNEVEELERWITEREAVASSMELGRDLEDVTVSALTSVCFTWRKMLQCLACQRVKHQLLID